MSRKSWNEYFMNMAEIVSTRATCDRKAVGSVIVKDKRIIATGYNGALPGQPHCTDPEDFWICNKCKEKFLEEPQPVHKLSCAGYGYELCHGGHIMVNNHCARILHSEINAILSAARFGITLEGSTIYCNTRPCFDCFKAIVGAGIKEIVYRDDYGKSENDLVSQLIKSLGSTIKFTKYIEE